MRVVLHPQVHSDISKIMEYYEEVGSPELAEDFYRELVHFIREAAERPDSYGIRERDLRRVNLYRFPYHFLFRVFWSCVTTGGGRRLATGEGE